MFAEVTFKCGHKGDRRVKGRGGPATDRSMVWWSERVCNLCWRDEQMRLAVEMSKELPALEGSEKQIAWASCIRLDTIAKLEGPKVDRAIKALTDNLDPIEAHNAMIRLVDDRNGRAALIKRVVSAKFWIDTRDEGTYLLLGHADADKQTVVTTWYADKVAIGLRNGRTRLVGGTKPRFTEHALAEV